MRRRPGHTWSESDLCRKGSVDPLTKHIVRARWFSAPLSSPIRVRTARQKHVCPASCQLSSNVALGELPYSNLFGIEPCRIAHGVHVEPASDQQICCFSLPDGLRVA